MSIKQVREIKNADGQTERKLVKVSGPRSSNIDLLVAKAEAAEAARLAEYNSESARYARLRVERDRRVAATDYLIMPDYPLDDEARAAVSAYRQALRDLPAQAGAPWDGGGEATPWPEMPTA